MLSTFIASKCIISFRFHDAFVIIHRDPKDLRNNSDSVVWDFSTVKSLEQLHLELSLNESDEVVESLERLYFERQKGEEQNSSTESWDKTHTRETDTVKRTGRLGRSTGDSFNDAVGDVELILDEDDR